MPTLWLPPNVWFQGSQSTSTGGSRCRSGKHWRIICWLLQIMRWVLITPFGSLVEPEVNRNLAIVSGPTFACAASTCAVARVASRSANASVLRPATAPVVSTTGVSGGRPCSNAASIAFENASPSAANTMPGVSTPTMCRSLPWSCESSE